MVSTTAKWTGRVVSCALFAACFSPRVPVGLPCSSEQECPDGQRCDLGANVCLAGGVWRDDDAAAFSGGLFDGTLVEAPGLVAPIPYLTGGVRAHGIKWVFTDPAATTWTQIADKPITGTGLLRSLDVDFDKERPMGLGLKTSADKDHITVWFEGEVYLTQGTAEATLYADDWGFLELALEPGVYQRLLNSSLMTEPAQFMVPESKWYPIRGAFADDTNLMKFSATIGGEIIGIGTNQLRTRVDDLTGFVVDGFVTPRPEEPTGSLLGAPLAVPRDDDLGIGIGDPASDWSLRWTGQVRIDVAGDYTFRLATTGGGPRAWIDGAQVADAPGETETSALTLTAGWHDVVVDLGHPGTDAGSLALTVADGPELVGLAFPPDRTRPVSGRGVRWSSRADAYAESVWDTTPTSVTTIVDAPPDAIGIDAQVTYVVTHDPLASLRVELKPPSGDAISVHEPATATALTGSGSFVDTVVVAPPLMGVGGSWTLTVTDTDTVNGNTGAILWMETFVNYRGGEAPFSTTARYTSVVRDLGPVAAFGPLRWALRQANGREAIVRLRTCATADTCADEPWTATKAIAASGDTPGAPPRRFAQYQVELPADGDIPTALDWIELTYTPAP